MNRELPKPCGCLWDLEAERSTFWVATSLVFVSALHMPTQPSCYASHNSQTLAQTGTYPSELGALGSERPAVHLRILD